MSAKLPKLPIYLDHAATTACDPRVVEAMLPYFTEKFGNPGSRNHSFGWAAEEAVTKARHQVAELIGADPKEIIFTSGATESNNLAIKGAANMYAKKPAGQTQRGHIISVIHEHKAVLDPCKLLEREGFEVTYLPVAKDGRVTAEQVADAIRDDTILISLMLCNNEIGTVHPIEEIGRVAKERKVLFHCDAVQGVGKMDFDVERMGVDLASLSAHKMYGPKGIGALYVRRSRPRVRLVAIIDGGGHERGMRSGTLPVPLIVGMGEAAEIARTERDRERAHLLRLRDRLRDRLFADLDEVYLNGAEDPWRHPGNLNVSFSFVEGEALMMAIKDIAVSSGSACTSASLEPSYVLRALGVPEELAHSSIRFGIGRFNTEEEIDYVGARVVEQVRRLRDMSPLYEMFKDGVDLGSIQWQAH